MQIMNGFRELHKHQIMHRDVKLANMFLKEDTIVIGDFGFAKQGVETTKTRLGTPITMAPELLMSKESSYTNKADLWSIGVVFYQLLFGKNPFDSKNYQELKNKVRTQSGDRLIFPQIMSVSTQCKKILVSLLQFDPDHRIEWRDFFNHELFRLHRESNHNQLQNSLLFRDNEDRVRDEFINNQQLKEEPNNIIAPEALPTNQVVSTKQ